MLAAAHAGLFLTVLISGDARQRLPRAASEALALVHVRVLVGHLVARPAQHATAWCFTGPAPHCRAVNVLDGQGTLVAALVRRGLLPQQREGSLGRMLLPAGSHTLLPLTPRAVTALLCCLWHCLILWLNVVASAGGCGCGRCRCMDCLHAGEHGCLLWHSSLNVAAAFSWLNARPLAAVLECGIIARLLAQHGKVCR